MSYCDDQYTKVPKPTASYTTDAKPVVSYTISAKPTASYTIDERPTASYTVVGKGTRPTTTIIPQPCLELLALLAEDGVELLYEDGRVMVREG